jgi:hypothetical protein
MLRRPATAGPRTRAETAWNGFVRPRVPPNACAAKSTYFCSKGASTRNASDASTMTSFTCMTLGVMRRRATSTDVPAKRATSSS